MSVVQSTSVGGSRELPEPDVEGLERSAEAALEVGELVDESSREESLGERGGESCIRVLVTGDAGRELELDSRERAAG